MDGYNTDLIDSQIELLTDHSTDEIFKIPDVESLVFPYSRIFCDVERLSDEEEPMFKYGRGFYYTNTDDGKVLRDVVEDIKSKIKTEYYDSHHNTFEKMVSDRLEKYGTSCIIDCHSFTNEPFETDIDKTDNRPDICLGTDDYHTPPWLIKMVKTHFETNGLSVKINSPYSGTIIPMKYFLKDKRVSGIMIEINRSLYMEGGNILKNKVEWLNTILVNLF